MHLPMLFIKNKITRRQLTIKRAFPDALDLLLICVETGMSIETGFKRVAEEIGAQWTCASARAAPHCLDATCTPHVCARPSPRGAPSSRPKAAI
jgi:hypothetical protein